MGSVGQPISVLLPAHAGMVRCRGPRPSSKRPAPRARGDGPAPSRTSHPSRSCSPRMRGWSGDVPQLEEQGALLPAHAGMVRSAGLVRCRRGSAPRARGDGPSTSAARCGTTPCSPRTRGWSDAVGTAHSRRQLLPAHAAMVRCAPPCPWCRGAAPRARGDGPGRASWSARSSLCSPRTREWSDRRRHERRPQLLLPRARGGGPMVIPIMTSTPACSPRTRGWSFLTQSRNPLEFLLPRRRGVVLGRRPCQRLPGAAPRARGGWSLLHLTQQGLLSLLPADAGVR